MRDLTTCITTSKDVNRRRYTMTPTKMLRPASKNRRHNDALQPQVSVTPPPHSAAGAALGASPAQS